MMADTDKYYKVVIESLNIEYFIASHLIEMVCPE